MGRVRITFWAAVITTIIAVGVLARAWESPSSAAAGVAVAVSGLVAAVAGTVALRIAVVVSRPRRHQRR